MNAPANQSPRTLACLKCGAPLTLRAPGFSVAVVCASCGSIIDASHPELTMIEKAKAAEKNFSVIALGARGRLRGIEYQMIGAMIRTDGSGDYAWVEYLLFNPYHGFRWLVCYNNHWTFVQTIKDSVFETTSACTVRDTNFDRFITGKAVVKYVLGEFYWRVRRGDTVNVADFVRPPQIMSLETDQSERIWSLGEYISGQEIYNAFKIAKWCPGSNSIGACQPNPYAAGRTSMLLTGILFFMIAIVIQVLTVSRSLDQIVLANNYTFPQGESLFSTTLSPADPTIITPSFVLARDTANLEIRSQCAVNNAWAFLEITLVNEETGVDYHLAREIAFYDGYDEGEYWSEGSKKDVVLLGAIPGGTYHLEIDASHEALPTASTKVPKEFSITVTRDTPYTGTFFLVVLLLIVPVAWDLWRHLAFEKNRWSESDYADDEDE